MTDSPPPKLLIVEDDEGLQRQLRWAYDDYEVLVASDRISTYDVVHPNPIPDKGKVLTGLSEFWFASMSWIVGVGRG